MVEGWLQFAVLPNSTTQPRFVLIWAIPALTSSRPASRLIAILFVVVLISIGVVSCLGVPFSARGEAPRLNATNPKNSKPARQPRPVGPPAEDLDRSDSRRFSNCGTCRISSRGGELAIRAKTLLATRLGCVEILIRSRGWRINSAKSEAFPTIRHPPLARSPACNGPDIAPHDGVRPVR